MTDDLKAPGVPELLPCPFCGEAAHVYTSQHHIFLDSIGCPNEDCGVQPSTDYLPEPMAIAAWNRRAALAPEDGLAMVEALRTALRVANENTVAFWNERDRLAADLAAAQAQIEALRGALEDIVQSHTLASVVGTAQQHMASTALAALATASATGDGGEG
jgi:hypothetical protein